MSLKCRGTFLEIVDSCRGTFLEIVDSSPDRRRHSLGAVAVASPDTPVSCGSYGHPELCASPCIRAFYSKCTKGFERELLSLMLSLLRDKCAKLPVAQQDVLQLLLAAVEHRVKSLQNTSTVQAMRAAPNVGQRAMLPLRRFSLGRIFEVIQQSHQVNVNFKMEMKRLVISARTAVHAVQKPDADSS
eukprot:s3077_g4.t1